jgi:branched-chain amino acid transport system permease protein
VSLHVALVIGGLAIGSIYALIAIGFAIVFKASHTLNFAHLGLMLLGGFMVFQSTRYWGLGFLPAVIIAAVITAVIAVIIYLLIAAPLVGRSTLAVLIATIGAEIMLQTSITAYRPWATDVGVDVGSPWGATTTTVLGARVFTSHLWVIGLSAAIVMTLFLVLQRSRWGLLFRAIAEDQEAAAANGVRVRTILLVVWAVSGILAAVAGAFVGTFPRLMSPTSIEFAIRAIPAVVIGGFDSIHGAIIGGALVGLVEVYTATYAPAGLGTNFHLVMPYILMFLVLMFRQQGLFGSAEVRRV